MYCEACEALQGMRENLGKPKQEKLKRSASVPAKERRAANKEIRRQNEEIEIAAFLERELNRYNTPFGTALIELCRSMAQPDDALGGCDLEALACALPQGESREDRALRSDAVHMVRAVKRTAKMMEKHPEWAAQVLTADDYERLYDLPEDTKEQRREKRALLKDANRDRSRYGKMMKPRLWAQRNILLCDAYADIDAFAADYPQAKLRLQEKQPAAAK